MTANDFDEIGWTHGKRRTKAPTQQIVNPKLMAELNAQRCRLALLEDTDLYRELCAEADARAIAQNNAPKYASGRAIK